MDPLDHLGPPRDGMPCTVCDECVPTSRIRLLAWRDDLAFLQVDCPRCLSTTLGFVAAGGTTDDPVEIDAAAEPISADDVLDMHQLLTAWHGDLVGLLARDRPLADPGR